MKDQYETLVARAEEFKAFAEGYQGPEQGDILSRINAVIADLGVMGAVFTVDLQ